MRNKKGALALSINAIVILIIAITMLGLALGFTRGMFGKAAGQFEELLGTEPEPPVPTGSDPVTLSKERIILILCILLEFLKKSIKFLSKSC